MAKFADHMEKIESGVVEGYKKIEDGVVTGYKKIEGGVVEGFTGIVDKMSGVMLDEEGKLKTGKVGEAVVGAYKKVDLPAGFGTCGKCRKGTDADKRTVG